MKTVFSKTTDKIILTAKISDDKLKLFVDAELKENQNITREEFISVIREFAKNAELNDGVIEDIVKHLNKHEKVEERRVSKGTPPVDGADGKILFLLKKFSPQAEIKEDEKGHVDLTNLHLFDNVTKGQIVGRLYPPKAGTDGVDALGTKIPAKIGKVFKPSFDKTLTLKDEKTTEHTYQVIVSEADGYLAEDSGKVMIKEELSISGDLDLRYGSIDFIGKVVVSGDVFQGLNIKANKGIEVRGNIRGGSLISAEGDIIVKGFVYGGKDSRVISGKSFSATIAHGVNAEIAGDIRIKKEALDCKLRSESSVYIDEGQIVGGETYVVCGIEAKFLGNQANQETVINFCSDVESRTEYARMVANIESHDKAKKLIETHLGPLANNSARIQLLKSPHREKMQSLYVKMQEVERGRISLLAQKKQMLEKARTNPTIRANYKVTCYEGVIIKAGDKIYTVKENLKGPGSISFLGQETGFEQGALQEILCIYNQQDKINNGDNNGPKKTK